MVRVGYVRPARREGASVSAMSSSSEAHLQSETRADRSDQAVLPMSPGIPVGVMPSAGHVEDAAELEQTEAFAKADGLTTGEFIGTGVLPHLTSRFRRQPEVVAMEVLHWILVADPVARAWFCTLLARLDGGRPPRPLDFEPEVQRDGIRPDLCAIEPETRQEVVLIEAKFWAALQRSQPLEYLKRAQEMLVILGPDQGTTTWLWPEVCARAGIGPDGVRELSHTLDSGKRICYLKWSDVLEINTSRPSTARAREELKALVDVYGVTDPALIDAAVLGPDGLARTESLMDLVARVRNHVHRTYDLRRQRGASAYYQAWHCYGGKHFLHGYEDILDKITWRVDLRFSFEEGEGPLVFELVIDKNVPKQVVTRALREVGHGAFRWDDAVAWQLRLRDDMPIDPCVHDAAEAIRDIVQRLTGLRLGKAVGAAVDADDDLPDKDVTADGI
jgi:hypothetical protein